MAEWVSPTSSGGNFYSNPENSYDGDTGTFATLARETGAGILYPASFISCSKVRLWAGILGGGKASFKIEVYYAGDYHQIHTGQLSASLEWVEIEIGSTQVVENVRLEPQTIILWDYLYEFEFWKEADAPTYVYGSGALKAGRLFQRM